MADITMCNNALRCPLRASCRRHLSVPSKWQSWQDFYEPGTECQHFQEFYREEEHP